MASEPTALTVGERYLPEMVSVTPLTGGGGAGGGGITIIYNPTIEIIGPMTPSTEPIFIKEIEDVLNRQRHELYAGVRA